MDRRKATGACLLRLIRNKNQRVSFIDASITEDRKALTVVVVDNEGTVVNAASVRTDRREVAEQAATALALVDRSRPFVYSDSKSAVRAFEKGSVANVAFIIIKACEIFQHYLCLFPAHLGVIEVASLNLNESAHAAARDLTLHSAPRHGVQVLPENRDSPSTYNEVTKYYLLNRRIYGLPHPKLNRALALTLRLPQTGTYSCPWRLNMFYPQSYTEPYCMDCGDLATLEHMLLSCERIEDPAIKDASRWEAALCSPDLGYQFWAVQQAREYFKWARNTVPGLLCLLLLSELLV